MKRIIVCAIAAACLTTLAESPRKVALIVQNHAAPEAHIPMMALTDALTAKLSNNGFEVVNPYNAVGMNQNRNAFGEKTPEVSAMELARQLKADGAITASIVEFLDSTIGAPPILHQYSVRVSFSLADAQTGAAVCGETIKIKSPKYTNNQVAANHAEYLGDLLHSAADECAMRLAANPRVREWTPTPPPPLPPPPPPINPNLTIADMDNAIQCLIGQMRTNPIFYRKLRQSPEGDRQSTASDSCRTCRYDRREISVRQYSGLVVGGIPDVANNADQFCAFRGEGRCSCNRYYQAHYHLRQQPA